MKAREGGRPIYSFPPYRRLNFKEGKRLCVLIEGLARVRGDGYEETVGPGGIFYSSSNVWTIKESRVLAVDPEQLKQQHPQLAARLFQKLQRNKPAGESSGQPPQHPGPTYTKVVTCPVCGHQFQAVNLFDYKLRLTGQDPDLRQHYENLEPLHYDIWACPGCLYACYKGDFTTLADSQAKKYLLQKALPERQQLIPQGLPEPGTPAYGLDSHRLALACLETLEAEAVKLGNLWLRLAWLYSDAGNREEELKARKSALKCFTQAYTGKASLILKQSQLDQLTYLLGILNFYTGDRKTASDFLLKYLHSPGRRPRLAEFAQNCLQEIKQNGRNEA